MKPPTRRLALLGAFLASLTLHLAPPAHAADECLPEVTVRTLQDDGPGSLRQAIQVVCPGGFIDFDVPLPSNIALAGTPLSINKSLTIEGPGADLLTVGPNRATLLSVGRALVRISGLTFAGGFNEFSGAGIVNGGNLELTDVVVADNFVDAFLTGAEGAGIYNFGVLNLRRVSVIGNSALSSGNLTTVEGPAIYNERGRVVIEDSLIADNVAIPAGPVLIATAALANNGGQMIIRNSTVADNDVASEDFGTVVIGVGGDGLVEIEQSTISRNGGAASLFGTLLSGSGTYTLNNTIAAENGVNSICASPNLVVSAGHNLFDAPLCAPAAESDLVDVDPQLLFLNENGGATATLALGPGSPALDAGDPDRCFPTDQRGVLRPQAGGCDIGAFESLPVDLVLSKRVSATQEVGPGESIVYTLEVRNVGKDDTVSAVVSDPLPPETVFVGPVTLIPPQPDAILADDPSDLPIIASNLTVPAGEMVTLSVPATVADDAPPDVTVINTAQVTSDEDPTADEGSASLQTCAFESVVATTEDGGAGSLRQAIEQSCPGAVVSFELPPSSTITLRGELLVENDLIVRGPGRGLTLRAVGSRHFRLDSANVQITDLTMTGGRAERGGAISMTFGQLLLGNVVLSNNAAREAGGAVYQLGGQLTIDQSSLTGNRALGVQGGGAVFSDGGVTDITRSTLANNIASHVGGAFAVSTPDNFSPSEGTVSSSTFSTNRAGVSGAGIHVGSRFEVAILNSTIADNAAPEGGAGITVDNELSGVRLFNTVLAGNGTAPDCAGGPAAFVSQGNNIDSDGSCGLTAANDLPGVEAMLGPLAPNGGVTLTHALLPGSPAIDRGSLTRCPTFDQRGVGRPLDGDGDGLARCDIGAFEGAATPADGAF
ncbi:MAG: choice-of-anchor Q domain-containing protein [Pseudomonadota bacterium]